MTAPKLTNIPPTDDESVDLLDLVSETYREDGGADEDHDGPADPATVQGLLDVLMSDDGDDVDDEEYDDYADLDDDDEDTDDSYDEPTED